MCFVLSPKRGDPLQSLPNVLSIVSCLALSASPKTLGDCFMKYFRVEAAFHLILSPSLQLSVCQADKTQYKLEVSRKGHDE